jgi:putative nucleotidyltransferase with HDIG domain
MNQDLEKIIATTGDIPPMPLVATKVMQLIEEEKANAAEIAQLITTDPALAARIMKLSNSAFYGCQRKIQTLNSAIMVLGFNTMRSMVIAIAVKEMYHPYGLTEKLLWEHSVGTAIAARLIANKTRLVNPDECFLAGLLHDIGKMVMNQSERAKFSSLVQESYNRMVPFCELEQSVFPYTHAELGGYVLKKWNLPDSLVTAVIKHHELTFAEDEDIYVRYLTATTALADRICSALGIGMRSGSIEEEVAAGREGEMLELTQEELDQLVILFKETFAEETSAFYN